jgi:20S proteasome alpha/beta subunit
MTVCIAAIAESTAKTEPKIVLCYDWKVSTAIGSAENKYKLTHIGADWVCLSSGNESDTIAFTRLLRLKFGYRGGDITVDETNAIQLVRDATAARKKEKADELTQGRYAISYDDFLKIGKEKFPPEIYRDTITEIGKLGLNADCLVCGFAENDPTIIETDSQGHVSIIDDFSAVGEGAYLAQAGFYSEDILKCVRLMKQCTVSLRLKEMQSEFHLLENLHR